MTARTLLTCILMLQSVLSFAINAEQAHDLIREQTPALLGDGSQLVSVYYFGHSMGLSVVGLERVGEDYLPIRWLVIFREQTVLGWYYPSNEFPLRFEDGHLMFPKGSQVEDVYLYPKPPKSITIENTIIPFHTP